MPQMQKFGVAANQQGSAFSYLIGVLMGDGCTYEKDGKIVFHLKTIDQDFADKVESCLRACRPEIKISRTIQQQHPTAYGKKPLHYVTTYDEIARILREVTHNKTFVPICVPRYFLQGFLDSEGFVSIHHDDKTGTIRLQVGMCKSGEYFHTIKKMIEKEGVKTQKTQIQRLPSGKVINRVRFNPQSFLESGLKFSIARKQNRLDAYRKAVDTMGKQRVKATFNDYKGELLQLANPRHAAKV